MVPLDLPTPDKPGRSCTDDGRSCTQDLCEFHELLIHRYSFPHLGLLMKQLEMVFLMPFRHEKTHGNRYARNTMSARDSGGPASEGHWSSVKDSCRRLYGLRPCRVNSLECKDVTLVRVPWQLTRHSTRASDSELAGRGSWNGSAPPF